MRDDRFCITCGRLLTVQEQGCFCACCLEKMGKPRPMTAFYRLGRLAAECDVEAARMPAKRAMWEQMAALARKEQVACLEQKQSKHDHEDQAAYLRGWGRA